jgi:hypothetical protein
MANTLVKEIGEFLDNSIGCGLYCKERRKIDEWALAKRPENNGYCTEPYFAYERALECPINKRREKECRVCHCESYDFCRLLRREGYII